MSKNKISVQLSDSALQLIQIKSKFEAEFRRFSLSRSKQHSYEDFRQLVEKLHHVKGSEVLLSYTDPRDGDLLPINNDDNLARALNTAKPLLRLIIQRKGKSIEERDGYGNAVRHKNIISSILGGTPAKPKPFAISNPHDFRMVSAIIDVDIVPETCRRVKLLKHGTERPLGFYIRDGTSVRVTSAGVERVPGIFVSRLVPGGLAQSTGLLAVNDEILEVNGIDVTNKTLDQVTDMMLANSSNLIITVKPANQRAVLATNTLPTPMQAPVRRSSTTSETHSIEDVDDDRDDQDEIVDLTGVTLEDNGTSEPTLNHNQMEHDTTPLEAVDDDNVLHL